MKHLFKLKKVINYAPERPADVKHCKAQTEKVRKHLGLVTSVTLGEGLK